MSFLFNHLTIYKIKNINIMKLTESQFKRIVNESVKKILKEEFNIDDYDNYDDFELREIPSYLPQDVQQLLANSTESVFTVELYKRNEGNLSLDDDDIEETPYFCKVFKTEEEAYQFTDIVDTSDADFGCVMIYTGKGNGYVSADTMMDYDDGMWMD